MYPVLNLTHVLDFLDTSGMGVTTTVLFIYKKKYAIIFCISNYKPAKSNI
jgi:hypothetical protein